MKIVVQGKESNGVLIQFVPEEVLSLDEALLRLWKDADELLRRHMAMVAGTGIQVPDQFAIGRVRVPVGYGYGPTGDPEIDAGIGTVRVNRDGAMTMFLGLRDGKAEVVVKIARTQSH